MKIEYDVDVDDLVALNRYAMTRPPALRRLLRGLVVGLVPGMLLLLVGAITSRSYWLWIGAAYSVFLVVLRVGTVAFAWAFARWLAVPLSIRLAGTRDSVLGHHTLTIEEGGVRELTAVNERFDAWPAVQRIDETRSHIYIFLTDILAHAIPKRVFSTSDEAEVFLRRVRDLWRGNKGGE